MRRKTKREGPGEHGEKPKQTRSLHTRRITMKKPLTSVAPRRFKHWAYLNEEGKKQFGDVFPKGEVPVVSMIPFQEGFYLVYHEEMAPDQVELLLTKIAEKFKASKEDVRIQMKEDRIPLRVILTNGSGTNGFAQFI